MKAIVLLFTDSTTDSERFVYPNIERIGVTIEGIPSSVYNSGIPKRRLFEEAQRLFEHHRCHPEMTSDNFFRFSKFAAVVDLRSICDQHVTGCGRKISEAQSGILLEITKKVTTENLKCHVYVIANGLVDITDGSAVVVRY